MRPLRLIVFTLVTAAVGASANAQTLYGGIGAGAATSQLYTINQTTAATTALGNIGFGITGLAFRPSTGVLYGVTTSPRSLITINTVTGAGTLIGATGGAIADISFRSDGTLFGWFEPAADDLVTINLTTGAMTTVGNAGLSTAGSGLAFNAAGTLYFAGDDSGGDFRTVNTSTGLTTIVATLSGGPFGEVAALAFHPVTDVLWGIVLNDPTATLVTINVATGAITTIGSLPDGMDGLAFSPGAVPTMPEWLFFVIAMILVSGGFFAVRRRARLA